MISPERAARVAAASCGVRASPMSTTNRASSVSGSNTSSTPSLIAPNSRRIFPSGECTSTELSSDGLMSLCASTRLLASRNSNHCPPCLPASGRSPGCGGVIIGRRSTDISSKPLAELRIVSRKVRRETSGFVPTGWLVCSIPSPASRFERTEVSPSLIGGGSIAGIDDVIEARRPTRTRGRALM